METKEFKGELLLLVRMTGLQPFSCPFDQQVDLSGLCRCGIKLDGTDGERRQMDIAALQGNPACLGLEPAVGPGLADKIIDREVGVEIGLISICVEGK